jgi:hypothetical protein
MSGGCYDYAYRHVEDFADRLDEHGSCDAVSPELRRRFAAHCRLVSKAMHTCEWNDCGDGDQDEEKLIREILGETREETPVMKREED